MSDGELFEADAEEMAKHINLGTPVTDYAKQKHTDKETLDQTTNRWMNAIEDSDPNLSQDMTSEYMDVRKTLAQITRLEKKVKAEEKGFENIDQYQSDKMLLDNLKAELETDAK